MDNNLYNPSVWLDQKRHCLLYLRETPLTVEFVQHVDRQVALLRLDRNTFHRDCKLEPTVSVASFVDTLLGTTRTGCVITPAARFALTQVHSSTNHKEGTMPKIPTKAPSAAKPAPKKVAEQEPLPFDTAKVVSGGKNPDPKASSVDPDNGVRAVPGGTVKTVPVAAAPAAAPAKKAVPTAAPAPARKAVPLEEAINAPDAAPEEEPVTYAAAPATGQGESFLAQAQQIVAEATAQAAQMVQEAKELLEVAVKKTEEKRALDDARADAKKILDKAKAEVAKIRAAVAKLGGKKPRGKAKAEGEKAARGTRSVYDVEDFKGRTIKQLAEPVVRGDSARGALTVAIYNCTTTDEAMEYKGASPSFIMKMVEKGIIELS
jgi:cell division septum initiation protein DivIVA